MELNSNIETMKKERKHSVVLGLAIVLFLANAWPQIIQAQSKSNKVVVKIVNDEGEQIIEMDTTFNHDVFVYQNNGDTKIINLDSVMNVQAAHMDKHMRLMAFKSDSLSDVFKFDGDFEKLHVDIDQLLEERGINTKELERLNDLVRDRMVFIPEEGEGIDVEEFADEEGHHIKVIRKQMKSDGDEEHGEKTYEMTSSSSNRPISRRKRYEYHSTVTVESIPLEDLSILKKAGVSSKQLMAQSIDISEVKVKVEKVMKDEEQQTLLHFECDLPEGNFTMEMINQEAKTIMEEKNIEAGPFKRQFDLKQDEAPYYFILSKNNRIFGRKIVL